MDGKNQRLILKMGFSSTNTRGQSSGRVKPGRGQRDASRIKTRSFYVVRLLSSRRRLRVLEAWPRAAKRDAAVKKKSDECCIDFLCVSFHFSKT